MKRLLSLSLAATLCGACALGAETDAGAAAAAGLLDRVAASWMSVVGVIGAADEEESTFQIDGDQAGEDRDRDEGEDRHRQRRHRDGGREECEHCRHKEHGHGRHHHGPPPHGMMAPGRMGPPGGHDPHHRAMRAFHEIIRRLGRIEEKLGIEDTSPGPRGDWSRRPHPEMRPPRGPDADAERPVDRLDIPEEVRRKMEERMHEGRRRMDEARQRMEEARKKFRDMEERIKQLEAEVARLKAGE